MDARKWKRQFMNTERERRKLKKKMEHDMFEMELDSIRSQREMKSLKAQISRNQHTIRGQSKVIQRLQKALRDNGVPEPSGTQVGYLKTCRATDDEICPLSLCPINNSPPPFNTHNTDINIEPHKPHLKCGELYCGNRFNGLWLLFYFISRKTFRCPICRCGHEDFRFGMNQLPKELVSMVQEAMKAR
jgi:hypothetical protein